MRIAGVTLTGSSLALSLGAGYAPNPGDEYVLIDNVDAGSSIVGVFDGLPEGANFAVGGYAFKISYTGGDGNDVVLASNVAPTISPITNKATEISTPISFTFSISDTDDAVDGLWLYAESSNLALVNGGLNGTLMLGGGISFSGSGTERTITITPTTEMTGLAVITVTVDDGGDSDYETFVLAVGVNSPPEFTSSPGLTATVGVAYSYAITAIDSDAGDTLTITATILPGWLTLADEGDRTAVLTGIPAIANTGPNTVTLQVSDGEAVVPRTFVITVEEGERIVIFVPLVMKSD